jgi:hypothetical protein
MVKDNKGFHIFAMSAANYLYLKYQKLHVQTFRVM